LASPTEDSVVVVAVGIQDSQTAKEALGRDTEANVLDDVDATHTAGKTVVDASKLLKKSSRMDQTSQP
jgi:hypothetical protein